MLRTFIICFGILSNSVIGFAQSPQKVLEEYQTLHNNHNIEKQLELYVHDAKFKLVGAWTKSGLDEMRALAEWDAALNSNLDFHIEEIRHDSIFCSVLERNDWFSAIGINPLVHERVILIIQNGLVHEIIAYPDPQMSQTIGMHIQNIVEWANSSSDISIEELFDGGEFIYSASTAEKWLVLLKKWNEK